MSSRELYEEEPTETASLLGTPEYMLSKAVEMGVCFHRGPAFEEHGGTPIFLGLWREGNFFILGNFYKKFERYVKKTRQKGNSLNRSPVEEPGVGSFTRNFERIKRIHVWVIFF